MHAEKAESATLLDGLPIDVYCAFFGVIGEVLLSILDDFLVGGVTPSFKHGRVVSILKEGGYPTSLGSWRPITFLNADYKSFASIIVSPHGPPQLKKKRAPQLFGEFVVKTNIIDK